MLCFEDYLNVVNEMRTQKEVDRSVAQKRKQYPSRMEGKSTSYIKKYGATQLRKMGKIKARNLLSAEGIEKDVIDDMINKIFPKE